MKPAGVILTYMSRQDWQGKTFWIKLRTIFSNAVLFVLQLMFMVAGTVYGKIKPTRRVRLIDKQLMIIVLVCAAGGIFCMVEISQHFSLPISIYWISPYWVFCILFAVASYRGIDWRRVWRAAQCSHVRLVLEEPDPEDYPGVWNCINFGYPKAEIQQWIPYWNKGNRRYRDPTFDPSPEFIKAMIQYAHDQVGKLYDELQLISTGLHLIAWIVYPWCWGKERKIIKALNRPGGLEHCTSGFTACLRWGAEKELGEGHINFGCSLSGHPSQTVWQSPPPLLRWFFTGYHTAVVPPCLVDLSEDWRLPE